MTWFRHHGKSYLLSEEEMTRLCHRRMRRRPHMNPKLRVHVFMESSLTPTPHKASMGAPPLNQYDSYYSSAFTNHIFLYKHHIMHHRTMYQHLLQRNKMKMKMELEVKMKMNKIRSQNPNYEEIFLAINTH
ncbi:hypothetical protein J1N35_044897 [Gossypium stocksii]|uniref:Uncharacterized protein n=1 Tax=Gossypium stocksii TaxID=47602 RepID=A0A9D3ZGV4_9ROSI|nr:hypothetical protein J1N35_044897 [Gossypium stocksii]